MKSYLVFSTDNQFSVIVERLHHALQTIASIVSLLVFF